MVYKVVLVERNPDNYRARGFETSADYSIVAGNNISLPNVYCLMVRKFFSGALENIKGVVD